MTKTFDRDKASKILEGYPGEEWDQETRDALLGQLETCYSEDARLSAIRNIVDEEISSVGLNNGTVLWSIYGILQGGLPITSLLPVEVSPAGESTKDQVVVTVQGVPAVLSVDQAQALIDSLQGAVQDSTDKAEPQENNDK